jgi:formylglycine-generating enzyme required for sulfatase activity
MRPIHANGVSFQMGGTYSADAMPVHTVSFRYDFWIDTTEVTQSSYYSLMGTNPSSFMGFGNRPVEKTTWFDAALYCNERSKRDSLDTVYSYTGISGIRGNGCTGLTGLAIDLSKSGYRLPTEAEWEYSCRAGTTTDYYWGSANEDAYIWYFVNSTSQTHPVATKLPNAWGLYDMNGNVAEWCNDWYMSFTSEAQTDPTGPDSSRERCLRGGSWIDGMECVLSAYRVRDVPSYRTLGDVGFRCARVQE